MVESTNPDTTDTTSADTTVDQHEGVACCEGVESSDRGGDRAAIESALPVLKALANEKRLAIVQALRDGELCACEIESVLDAPQSTVASNLGNLREAGIVATREDGKWTYYRIADTASLQVIDLAAALGDRT